MISGHKWANIKKKHFEVADNIGEHEVRTLAFCAGEYISICYLFLDRTGESFCLFTAMFYNINLHIYFVFYNNLLIQLLSMFNKCIVRVMPGEIYSYFFTNFGFIIFFAN